MFLKHYYHAKRKIKRAGQTSQLLSFRSKNTVMGHRADFAWRSKQANPYHISEERLSLRTKIKIWTLILCIAAIAALIGYHPFFDVRSIVVYGQKRVDAKDVRDRIGVLLEERSFFFFQKKNYFFANTREIEKMLTAEFSLHTAAVEKIFPHRLVITIDEKLSTIIYDDGSQYYLLGKDGAAIEIIRPVGEDEWKTLPHTALLTNEEEDIESAERIKKVHMPPAERIKKEIGDYPIIYDSRRKVSADSQNSAETPALLDPALVSGALQWFTFLKTKTDIPFGYILLENDLEIGIIKTAGEGWEIRAHLTRDLDKQFAQIKAIEPKINRANLSYIDVRYGDRVFWK